MTRHRSLALPLVACCALLAVAGCKRTEPDTATPPAASTIAAPPPSELTTVPPAATPDVGAAASVTGLELGSAAGADMRITTPKTTFGTRDKIIVAVTTRTSDPNNTVPAKVGAKWTHLDSNQVVHEDSRDFQLKGEQVHDFEITNPDAWPTGRYKVDVMVDGNVVQSREFAVR